MASLRVVAVPTLADNYCWRLENDAHALAVLVDPADASVALASVPAHAELAGVLTTHWHVDHSGGNVEVAAARPGVPVVGGAAEEGRVPAATRLVADGERVELGGFVFTALHTPCHTKGHICYYTDGVADADPALFCGEELRRRSRSASDLHSPPTPPAPAPPGDTLFAGGCGRFFEGDAPTMLASFAKLKALPPATRVYAGHEYSVANLRFGAAVEPANRDIAAALAEYEGLRARGLPTLPSSMARELATNVFLRTSEPAVRAFTHPALDGPARAALGDAEVLAVLRERKNAFKA